MLLGIEIGGTKLQLAVGPGCGTALVELRRLDVEPARGAEGVLRQIAECGAELLSRHQVSAVGFGFGGPIDAASGLTITSHQVEGWDNFPLAEWCRDAFGLPAVLINDSDAAGLAEARFGAGQGGRVVFYSNVGSGIGGALVLDGNLFCGGSGVASELGHLRPGLHCDTPDQTLESMASGWAIAAAARSRIAERPESAEARDLLARCDGRTPLLTTRHVADAAIAGNAVGRQVFAEACEAYGWALAQMITLLAPNIVVLGGGVSLVGEELFLAPVRAAVDRFVFPPHRGTFEIRPAALGEEVVLHGAMALAGESP
ncbi:MAG: ROK family protein [Planctomycetaceae bacterium]|nr:ROK family protein [Planctomycetaceae bacterium]